MSNEHGNTPTLVGWSVRNINDSKYDHEGEPLAKHGAHQSRHAVPGVHRTDSPYTSVEDLNREGALLTDELDVAIDNMSLQHTHEEDPETHRRLLLLKKKKLASQAAAHPHLPPTSGTPGSNDGHLHHHVSLERVSRLESRSRSLVTSTDPSPYSLNPFNGRSPSSLSPNRKGGAGANLIKNSYGEIIIDGSHRPHLARGDSYQSITAESDHEMPPPKSQSDTYAQDKPTERAGRNYDRKLSNKEYLRSLSRSLSKDPHHRYSRNSEKHSMNYSNDANLEHELTAQSSTSSYHIQLNDLGNVQVSEETELMDSDKIDEVQGTLMDDEGNEEYPQTLRVAAEN